MVRPGSVGFYQPVEHTLPPRRYRQERTCGAPTGVVAFDFVACLDRKASARIYNSKTTAAPAKKYTVCCIQQGPRSNYPCPSWHLVNLNKRSGISARKR